ncbi:prosalpha6 [Vairimorpha apis BRL 01]|uniref:Prosalpha6 n=1 Tax=Vairimorpha apis BRL 01 TaxID=1037528 RepID=T0L633_9MICR|nr:prosalpha6 [Vairimorpha apis BRL 01]
MSVNYEIYNIFNNDGKILQVEYGLEAVNNSIPLVIVKNNNIIVCAAKKMNFEDEIYSSFQPIYTNVYSAFTGRWADVHFVNKQSKDLAYTLSYNLGFTVTPDILCRELADKMQIKMQSVGERCPAFGGAFFGFDNNIPIVSMTNMSAICYPVYGLGVGERSQNMMKYLEKYYKPNLDDSVVFQTAVGALLESIGEDSQNQEIEVAYLRSNEHLKYLNINEIEDLLLAIAEQQ